MWVCPCVQTVTVDFINVYHAKGIQPYFCALGHQGKHETGCSILFQRRLETGFILLLHPPEI